MPQIDRSTKTRRTVRRTINAATAAEAVGPITPGIEVYGLSKGQFSLVELVEHCLDATGPADLTISTWTAAGADLEHVQTLLTDGRILTARWLVDFSFPARQPAYCAQLRERFGDDTIRCTANHAKFVMIRNATWNVVVRTSMNLNLNRRLESYEISDDSDLADWLTETLDAAFAGEAATVEHAASSPADAQRSISTMHGTVETRQRDLFEYRAPKGISYD